MKINIKVALLCGILGTLFVSLCAEWVSTTFLPQGSEAWQLCNEGLPIFSSCFLFVILNLTLIGYFQSTEKAAKATVFTIFRGIIFMLPSFIIMPLLVGSSGLWLAQSVSEIMTLFIIFLFVERTL